MGTLGLSDLLLAVEVWLVVDCSGLCAITGCGICDSVIILLKLVDFCDSLVGSLDSLDSVGAQKSGPDSGMAFLFGFSLSYVPAEWPFMATG